MDPANRDIHPVRRAAVAPVQVPTPPVSKGTLQGRAVEVRQVPGAGADNPMRSAASTLQEHGVTVKSGTGAVVVTATTDGRAGVPLAKQGVAPGGHTQVGQRKPH